jgi:hypothetical protein
MKKFLPILFILAGCAEKITMPTPVVYPSACPAGDEKCQRNLDAQTLHYIGESDAAVMLLCQDKELSLFMETCGIPSVY